MVSTNVLKAIFIVGGVVLIVFTFITIIKNNSEQYEFEKFMSTYNKSYVNETEREVRFNQFKVRYSHTKPNIVLRSIFITINT